MYKYHLYYKKVAVSVTISLFVICITVYNVHTHICCAEVIYMCLCHLTYTNAFISYALDQPFSGEYVRHQKKAMDKIIDSVIVCQTLFAYMFSMALK